MAGNLLSRLDLSVHFMKRVIDVVAFDNTWRARFLKEKVLLEAALQPYGLVHIHHIGSTAIADIAAKPIIDILLEVDSLQALDLANEQLARLGYQAKGENGIVGRRYFQKGGFERTHHVHAFKCGHVEVTKHLAFRDYINAHADLKMQYEQIKLDAAMRHRNDSQAYCEYKAQFIAQHLTDALAWYKLHNTL